VSRRLGLNRERRVAGDSLRQIRVALESAGHAPKRGARWHPDTIRKILDRYLSVPGLRKQGGR